MKKLTNPEIAKAVYAAVQERNEDVVYDENEFQKILAEIDVERDPEEENKKLSEADIKKIIESFVDGKMCEMDGQEEA